MTDEQVRTFSWAPPTLWTCPRCGTTILLGWKQVPIHIVPLAALVYSLNILRTHYTPSQRAMFAAKRAKWPSGKTKAKACKFAGLDLTQPEAAKEAGVAKSAVRTAKRILREGAPEKEIARGEFHENAVRLDFLPSELAAIMQAVGPAERQAAKARQKATQFAGRETGGKAKRVGGGKLPPPKGGDTRDQVARYVGVSGRTLEKAVEVVEAAEADPSLATRDAAPRCGRCGYVEGT